MRSCGSIAGARPCGTKPRAWGTQGGHGQAMAGRDRFG
jgi:hypothetical protein